MNSRKIALRETGIIALGEAIGTALMIAVFALLDKFDTSVLLGGILGAVIAVVNFFAMAVVTTLAGDRAEAQDVEGGKKLLQASYPIRMLALAAILFLCARSGVFHVAALVIPLLFVRPTITLAEFFRKERS